MKIHKKVEHLVFDKKINLPLCLTRIVREKPAYANSDEEITCGSCFRILSKLEDKEDEKNL